MQSNTITIGTDIYDRFQEFPDRSVYTAIDHTIGLSHLFSLSRVVPTSEGASARGRVKFVRDVIDATTGKKGTIYVTIETSQPIWADESVVTAEAERASVFLQGTEFQSLLHKQSI